MIPTVLLIEDDPDIIQLIGEIFVGQCDVVPLLGRQAINFAADHHPDAIILDMMLPMFSGSSILAYLREEKSTKDIPVIVVTAVSGHDATYKTLGATGVLHKPFRVEALRDAVASAIRGKTPQTVEE